MLTSTLPLFQSAFNRYDLGAYSVNSIEQIVGVFQGAQQAQAPVIFQVSGKARRYAGPGVLEAAIHAAARHYPQVAFAIHLDHGDEQDCLACIASGQYSSVMIDASMHPLAENIAISRRVAEAAHARGISVEAELGRLGGKEDDIAVDSREAYLTDPAEALTFASQSGIDSLAVAIGTSHGVSKFRGDQSLHLARLEQIHTRLPALPLVLHGASSVPRAEVERINALGGAVDPQARGVPEEQYRLAAQLGITKINIDTDSRLLWARVYRQSFREQPANVDLRQPGEIFIQEVAGMVAHHSGIFGCAGQAGNDE